MASRLDIKTITCQDLADMHSKGTSCTSHHALHIAQILGQWHKNGNQSLTIIVLRNNGQYACMPRLANIHGKLFALVAASAGLCERLQEARQNPKELRMTGEFHLDGCMEMDITFDDKTLKTPVYIKMDTTGWVYAGSLVSSCTILQS